MHITINDFIFETWYHPKRGRWPGAVYLRLPSGRDWWAER